VGPNVLLRKNHQAYSFLTSTTFHNACNLYISCTLNHKSIGGVNPVVMV
jgi:hypothetical protein